MKKYIFSLSLLIIFYLLSCKRENVTKKHSELIGSWKHITETEAHYISIGKDGRGNQKWYKNGKFDRDTQSRKWFVKKDYLLFGRLAGENNKESYKITMYPEVATYSFVTGYDTIMQGTKYMTLDGNIYH